MGDNRVRSVMLPLFWVVLCGVAILLGCAKQSSPGKKGKLQVFVNIPPQAYLVDKVGGKHVNVETLIQPGDNPHTFSATPRQVMALGRSDIYFRGMMPFERQLAAKVKGTKLTIRNLTSGIKLRRWGKSGTGVQKDGETAGSQARMDPHVWLSPRALKQQARNIASALIELDPKHKSHYKQNLNSLLNEIQQLDQRLESILKPYRGRTFFVFHPAFGYFARAYQLHQRAVQVEGKDPTAKELRELINQAKQDNVRIIFVQPQFKSQSARAIASAIDGAVVPLDPMKRNVLKNLEKIARTAEKAFGG